MKIRKYIEWQWTQHSWPWNNLGCQTLHCKKSAYKFDSSKTKLLVAFCWPEVLLITYLINTHSECYMYLYTKFLQYSKLVKRNCFSNCQKISKIFTIYSVKKIHWHWSGSVHPNLCCSRVNCMYQNPRDAAKAVLKEKCIALSWYIYQKD